MKIVTFMGLHTQVYSLQEPTDTTSYNTHIYNMS